MKSKIEDVVFLSKKNCTTYQGVSSEISTVSCDSFNSDSFTRVDNLLYFMGLLITKSTPISSFF